MKDDPESSKELLDCYYEYYVEVTEEVNQRQKKKIKEFILALEDGKFRWKSKVFYDVKSHLIVENSKSDWSNSPENWRMGNDSRVYR